MAQRAMLPEFRNGDILKIQTASTRGWREPGNSIKDPGMARTGIGFLVLLLNENT